MKRINYNAKTGETIIEEVTDIEISTMDALARLPTDTDRISALETLILQIGGII